MEEPALTETTISNVTVWERITPIGIAKLLILVPISVQLIHVRTVEYALITTRLSVADAMTLGTLESIALYRS
jgi:hypothetical protein